MVKTIHIFGVEGECVNHMMGLPDNLNNYDLVKIAFETNIAHLKNTLRSSCKESKLHFSLLIGPKTFDGFDLNSSTNNSIELGKKGAKETFGKFISGIGDNEVNIFLFEFQKSSQGIVEYIIKNSTESRGKNILIGIYPIRLNSDYEDIKIPEEYTFYADKFYIIKIDTSKKPLIPNIRKEINTEIMDKKIILRNKEDL